jgi:hypothetical protein
MPIDPTDLAKSIGAIGSLDRERGLAPTLQQIADAPSSRSALTGSGSRPSSGSRGAARSSTRRLADVAKDVTNGQPLPASRRKPAMARAGHAKDREVGS